MRVKVISDGTLEGTEVQDEIGQPIERISYLKLELDANQQTSTLTLKVFNNEGNKIETKLFELVESKMESNT